MNRTELDAMVSFLVVHHPIPALPVVCGQGEGAEYRETVASSHDLLANGIRFDMTHAENYSEAQLVKLRDAKTALLSALQQDITDEVAYWRDVSGELPPAGVERCYLIYCTAARAYQALYPGSLDMRTQPMDAVCRHDTVHAQSLAHLLAREDMFVRERASAQAPGQALSASHSYRDIVRASVLQLSIHSGGAVSCE